MEEGAAELLEEELEMEVEDTGKGEGKVEEGGEGASREMGDLELLTQYAEPSGKTLVDARNGFNELSRLAMMWTVWYRW